jgi:Leucine-rich repeat (LRR) protein
VTFRSIGDVVVRLSIDPEVPQEGWVMAGGVHFIRRSASGPAVNESDAMASVQQLVLDDSFGGALDGLETLSALEELSLRDPPGLDFDDLLTRVARLPRLIRITLGPRLAATLPEGFGQLTGLLQLTVNGVAALDLDAFFVRLAAIAGPPHLTLIDRRTPIELPPSIAGLAHVRRLAIAPGCRLPHEVTHLHALEALILSSGSGKHYLTALPPAIGDMAALQHLSLRGQRLKALPPSVVHLTALRELDLLGNHLAALPERFGALRSLEKLDLSHCKKLFALPESFGELAQLRTLLARDSGLAALPARFGDLHSLETLDLSGCSELIALPESFGALAHLRKLLADGTGLAALPASFARLRLQTCKLPAALDTTVTLAPPEVGGVDELTLDRQYETSLPDDLGDPRTLTINMPTCAGRAPQLARLRRLETLVIRRCQLDLDDAFRRLAEAPNLTFLSLDHWQLPSLPASIGALVHLTSLWLRYCELRTLPPEIGALTRLATLQLQGNPLEELPAACGSLTGVEALELAHQTRNELPRGISHFGELATLSARWLTSLPDELAALPRLQTLYLRGGPLTSYEVLGRLPALTHLTLYQQEQCEVRALFKALARTPLRHLSLSDTRIDVLPPEIAELSHLEYLNLCGTRLGAVPAELAQLAHLRAVDVDGSITPAQLEAVLPKNGRWRQDKLIPDSDVLTYRHAPA